MIVWIQCSMCPGSQKGHFPVFIPAPVGLSLRILLHVQNIVYFTLFLSSSSQNTTVSSKKSSCCFLSSSTFLIINFSSFNSPQVECILLPGTSKLMLPCLLQLDPDPLDFYNVYLTDNDMKCAESVCVCACVCVCVCVCVRAHWKGWLKSDSL